jgi:DNA repair protein RadC
LIYKTKVSPKNRVTIKVPNDAAMLFWEVWDKDSIEHIEEVKLMLLNRANKVLGIANLSKGGTSGSVIDIKVLFQYVIKSNASSFIIAHNHPSGNLIASENDKNITKTIKDAAAIMSVSFLDHIIITPQNQFTSIIEEHF